MRISSLNTLQNSRLDNQFVDCSHPFSSRWTVDMSFLATMIHLCIQILFCPHTSGFILANPVLLTHHTFHACMPIVDLFLEIVSPSV